MTTCTTFAAPPFPTASLDLFWAAAACLLCFFAVLFDFAAILFMLPAFLAFTSWALSFRFKHARPAFFDTSLSTLVTLLLASCMLANVRSSDLPTFPLLFFSSADNSWSCCAVVWFDFLLLSSCCMKVRSFLVCESSKTELPMSLTGSVKLSFVGECWTPSGHLIGDKLAWNSLAGQMFGPSEVPGPYRKKSSWCWPLSLGGNTSFGIERTSFVSHSLEGLEESVISVISRRVNLNDKSWDGLISPGDDCQLDFISTSLLKLEARDSCNNFCTSCAELTTVPEVVTLVGDRFVGEMLSSRTLKQKKNPLYTINYAEMFIIEKIQQNQWNGMAFVDSELYRASSINCGMI